MKHTGISFLFLLVLLGMGLLDASAQNLLIPQEYSIELEDSAEIGFADAQYKIGKYYYQQYVLLVDGSRTRDEARKYKEIAKKWFKKAVAQGNVGAMYGLSQAFYDRYDGALSDSLYLWLEKAASANDADAQYDLYTLYEKGKTAKTRIFKKDKKKSEQYFQMALRNGSVLAYWRMYYRAKSDTDKMKYVKLLAEKQVPGGLVYLAKAYSQGKGIAKNPQKALEIWNNLIDDRYKPVKESLKDEVNDHLKNYYFSIGDSSKGFEYQAKLASTGYGLNAHSLSQKAKTDPVAQYWEASLYCKDKSLFGLDKSVYGSDIKKCETLLLQSAQQGYAPAMGKLAYCFLDLDGGKGLGGPKQAYEWALKGAEKNDTWAQWILAQCYLMGYGGCKKDTGLAVKYLTKASDEGLSQAQVLLAALYEIGRYVEQNTNKAIDLYEKAARQGHVNALKRLGSIYAEQGDYEKSYQYFLKVANLKEPYSIFRLGLLNALYRKVSGTENSVSMIKKGLRLLHKADSMGNEHAPYYIGFLYHNGLATDNGVTVVGINTDRAIEYYKRSAERGFPFATDNLAHLYYEGKIVPKNGELAFKYAREAAENTRYGAVTNAMRLLAACYRYGIGTKTDSTKEKYWMEQAAKNKDVTAMEVMGEKIR